MINIFDLRRDFTLRTLDEKDVLLNPIAQFEIWFKEAIEAEALEPNAMNLATVGFDMKPSSRIVLLKQVRSEGFVFFTNYDSRKAKQMAENSNCALTFVWQELERQVRIEGRVEKILPEESDLYFERRPVASKLGAWSSPQSSIMPNREYLENLVADFEQKFANVEISRPANWGGYLVRPTLVEFWQGRANRLHDRIQYTYENKEWIINRLAP
ncbi:MULTISPECIES: pyridoxamine 5'-phosphate oxidase [unclassified Dysgonomonas]|uniref:pyridoxamine 5'-phosphate oxidase n=1 Tax=unclassified Dysgonomonas TaxID=2630389 RepID=UPI0006824769|nr:MULTISPECIES: pyridoxamine 5'-phosphate oxidase [unclassified Dysgonomonas]MBD8349514.1 pyridoxamine 5'-phosphate oxidase [Dysgonomonas sp. HGC4]MBF0577885.1 pyridoxamine 5'-phosphate oxidase [Dysgonomonas sp. GY617]